VVLTEQMLTVIATHFIGCTIYNVGEFENLLTLFFILSKHLSYNQNSFIHTYNNGRIEGINNQINVLIISKYSRH